MNTDIDLRQESLALARKTLLNSMLSFDSTLVGTDVEDVRGQPLVYFDFRSPNGTCTRVYAD